MKTVVFNGTDQKGITYWQKSAFLDALSPDEITEFFPEQMPHFCEGCKACFFSSESLCPHAPAAQAAWKAALEADILVFAYPVYALRVPASLKSLLDHWAVHWMVHRPDPRMFTKRAVIITNASGPVYGSARRDVATSLHWLGVSRVSSLSLATMGNMHPDALPSKARFERSAGRLAQRLRRAKPPTMSVSVRCTFLLCRAMHRSILRTEETPSADNAHWIEHGWLHAAPERPSS